MRALFIAAGLLPILFAACGNDPPDPADFAVSADSTEIVRAPCSEHDPLRVALFGDLHVHTALSTDAWNYDLEVRPRGAYAYAFGEPILLPPKDAQGRGTREVRIDRPLRFRRSRRRFQSAGYPSLR